ncbi:MAG: hypothetical protein M3132_06240 [Actinomycetia bacterium]|nr:hypothetical protein [Actinomycetes bacterium]
MAVPNGGEQVGVRLNRSTVIARGKNQEAAEFATKVSSYLGELTGVPVIWGLEVGGTVGKVHWYADYESLAALETAFGQLATDQGYQALLDTSVDIFVGAAEDTWVYLT